MILEIFFPFFSKTSEINLSARYALVDDIEDQNIGVVLEEGTGTKGIHVLVKIDKDVHTAKDRIQDILLEIGVKNHSIKTIDDREEE